MRGTNYFSSIIVYSTLTALCSSNKVNFYLQIGYVLCMRNYIYMYISKFLPPTGTTHNIRINSIIRDGGAPRAESES